MPVQDCYLLANQREFHAVVSCEEGESSGLLPDQQGTRGHPNQQIHCLYLKRGHLMKQDVLIHYLGQNIVTCGLAIVSAQSEYTKSLLRSPQEH